MTPGCLRVRILRTALRASGKRDVFVVISKAKILQSVLSSYVTREPEDINHDEASIHLSRAIVEGPDRLIQRDSIAEAIREWRAF